MCRTAAGAQVDALAPVAIAWTDTCIWTLGSRATSAAPGVALYTECWKGTRAHDDSADDSADDSRGIMPDDVAATALAHTMADSAEWGTALHPWSWYRPQPLSSMGLGLVPALGDHACVAEERVCMAPVGVWGQA